MFLPRKTLSPFGVGKMRDLGIHRLTGRRTPIVMEEKGIKRSSEIWDGREEAASIQLQPLTRPSACCTICVAQMWRQQIRQHSFKVCFAIRVFNHCNLGVFRCDEANVTTVKTTNQKCKSLAMIKYSHFSFYWKMKDYHTTLTHGVRESRFNLVSIKEKAIKYPK